MPNREEMERTRAAMEGVMRMSNRLIIVKAEVGYLLTEDDGPFETSTKWQDGKLRIERKFKGGLKVVYDLDAR